MIPLKHGDSGPDVRQLYMFLKRFGYFPNPGLRTGNALFRPAVVFAPEDLTLFDDRMELALSEYQRQHGIEPTGALNEETLTMMRTPRCGFPDQPSAGQFVAQGNRWPTNEVTYSFTPPFSPDVSEADQRAALRAAFDRWAAVTNLTFTEVGNNGQIRIAWAARDHGDGFPFDGQGSVLAHCFYPPPNGGDIAGDCHFDEDETWSVNVPPSGFDLYTVALHEIGHGLGLAHSADNNAVMFPSYQGVRRELSDDDIQGIRSIYGARAQWSSLQGIVFATAAGTNADGRLEVFVRGTDNAVHHNWQTSPGGGWSGWSSLGGVLQGRIAVGRNHDGRLEIFGRGTDGGLYHNWQTAPNSGWSGWSGLGGWIEDPAVGSNADGRLEVFVRGTDGAVYHNWQVTPGGGWSGWSGLGGVIQGRIAVGRNHDGRLEIFGRGTDGGLYHNWQTAPNGGWSGWHGLGGWIEDPVVGVNPDGRLEVFVRGSDSALHHIWQVTPGGGWSGWASLGGWIDEPSVARNGDGRLEVFVRGLDNTVYHIWQVSPGGGWSGWSGLGGEMLEGPIATTNHDGRLEVFIKGTDSALWHRWQTAPSNGWS
ncbi:matrixin family metalloprotease [Nonomuraea sp. NPDC055795]